MTISKERVAEFIKNPLDNGLTRGEQMELARMALAGMEAEPTKAAGFVESQSEGTDKFIVKGYYGQRMNAGDKIYTAPQPLTTSERAELENYRNAQQVVPGEKVIGTFNAEKNELALLDKNMTVERFAHWHVHNSLEVIVRDSRAAMLQGKAEPVTTAYKLPFEQWLSQQNEPIDIDCGCVTTEAFYHWLRVAYSVGNTPVIPDGWVMVPVEPTDAMVEAMYKHQLSMRGALKAAIAAAPQQEAE